MKKWALFTEKVALIAMVVLIPTQLGKHWWPEWSLVAGIPVDYLSPTLYLIDLAWLSWAVSRVAQRKTENLKVRWWWLLLALVNIVVAENKAAAIMGWGRWWQWWTVVAVALQNKEEFIKILVRVIPWWALVEAGLGLAQVINGGSVGGIFWLLGERRFSLNSVGAAVWGVGGEEWVRAMGTFSHPNSLAGFTLLLTVWWWFNRDKWRRSAWGWASLMGMGIIIFLGASRTVWLAGLILGIGLLIRRGQLKQKIAWVLLATGGILMLTGIVAREYDLRHFAGGWDINSAQRRVELVGEAGEMIWRRPLVGAGLNNWFNRQNKAEVRGGMWRQPVHNIGLLWTTEAGIIGLGLALRALWGQAGRKKGWRWLAVAGVILTTGMADHYWLTLAQNRWLWGIIWAII